MKNDLLQNILFDKYILGKITVDLGNGMFKDMDSNSSYIGMLDNGKRHGEGIEITCKGEIYRGLWKNNKKQG